jgi:NAD kinase
MGKLKPTTENIYVFAKKVKNWVKTDSRNTILGINNTFEGFGKDFSAKLELILLDGGSGSMVPIQHMQVTSVYDSNGVNLGSHLFIQEFPGKDKLNYKFLNLYNYIEKMSNNC